MSPIISSTSININTIFAYVREQLPPEVTDIKVLEICERILRIQDLNLNLLSISGIMKEST